MTLPPLANLSLWQRTVRDHPLLNGTHASPPAKADVVVIGGGLCGAVIAYHLLTDNSASQAPSVVVLEARELASGASGRNAGHCRPDPARGFTGFEKLHGAQQARAICESEAVALERTEAFIKQHDIQCEWTRRRTYDVCLSPEFDAYFSAALEGIRSAGGSPAVERLEGAAAVEATRIQCESAYGWDAATLNPAQLTLGVHSACAERGGYAAVANAPVTNVERADDSASWIVRTPKGAVRARKVIWATNGYAGEQLPELSGVLVPQLAGAHKFSAPSPPLESSYSFRESTSIFYSVAPRPDGSVVLGVSRAHAPVESYMGITNDRGFSPILANAGARAAAKYLDLGVVRAEDEVKARAAAASSYTPISTDSSADVPWWEDSSLQYAWSGVIGCTPDAVPLIGARLGFEGQYLAVGYNGHGMARIFVTAPALARFVCTGEWDADMPACFRVSDERLARLRDL